jgi:CDP-2,3-bis-(O-geranylgeranyl)-sn-glycerol synthase
MLILILQSFYFILPAYVANMFPVFFAKLNWWPVLNRPIDGGAKLGGRELFGKNKTWRGLLAGILGGIIVAGLQALLYQFGSFKELSILNYQQSWLIFGFLAGSGALLGDLAKSFFKRRAGITSGGAWPVFDQLDLVIGFLIFTYYLARPDWQIILTVLIMTLLLHPMTNIIGYLLGIKKVWW